MDEERKKRVASQGGLASAKGKKTSNRGFASMDKNKQREISSRGGKASRNTQSQPPVRNEKDAANKDIIREEDTSVRDLNALEENDNLGSSGKKQGPSDNSDTDEDEDEGIGDGNPGRSTRDGLHGE